MQKNKNFKLHEAIRIREEKDHALLFDKRNFSIRKLSIDFFYVLKKIDCFNYSFEQLINEEKFENIQEKEELEKLISLLLDTKCIVYGQNDANKVKQIFLMRDLSLNFQAPNFVWWDITSLCNLKCYYCYSSSGKKQDTELSTLQIYKILDELNDMGIFFVFILGGEPQLRENIEDIVRYISKLGLGLMITTNGTLITEQFAKALKDASTTIVRVSIDADEAVIHDEIRGVKGCFNKSIAGVKMLAKYNFNSLGFSTTILPENYKRIKNIIFLAKSLQCNHIQMTVLSPTGRACETNRFLSEEQIIEVGDAINELYQDEAKNNTGFLIDAPEGTMDKEVCHDVFIHRENADFMGCGGGRTCLAIYSNGDVGYCLLHRNKLNNLQEKDFKLIWKDINVENNSAKSLYCNDCIHNEECAGPCLMLENQCVCEREEIFNQQLKKEVK